MKEKGKSRKEEGEWRKGGRGTEQQVSLNTKMFLHAVVLRGCISPWLHEHPPKMNNGLKVFNKNRFEEILWRYYTTVIPGEAIDGRRTIHHTTSSTMTMIQCIDLLPTNYDMIFVPNYCNSGTKNDISWLDHSNLQYTWCCSFFLTRCCLNQPQHWLKKTLGIILVAQASTKHKQTCDIAA